MTSWLLETLAWTAALIALVLVLRRPVTHWFGPQFAYALWALPALRLLLPPLELPAWMRPETTAPQAEPATATTTQFAILDPVTPVATQDGTGRSEVAATDLTTHLTPTPGFDIGPFVEAGLAVWLIGAAIFLYLRFAAYFRLRSDLLKDARDVGREGKVRLVETHGTKAPLAFGVIDKVIALPEGFLAQPDRQARDLALAHEMAHHQGRDLLVNVLVQPLFALHWFSPLGRYGWLALRRDQEAACDARVMAQRAPETLPQTREAYANLIVSYAAQPGAMPNHALTAPMACPVLGDKSIVHRLRSLKMNDTPKSRRLAGRLMLGAAVIALPLTASISYAAVEAPAPPAPPAAPLLGMAALGITPPAPPAPPAPPIAPNAPLMQEIEEIDPDVDVNVDVDVDTSSDGSRSENVFVYRTDEDGEVHERRWRRSEDRRGGRLSEADADRIMVEVRASMAEANAELERLPEIIEEAMEDVEEARLSSTIRVVMSCDSSSEDVTSTFEGRDGMQVVQVCEKRVMTRALEGLRQARNEIARNDEMSEQMRERVVHELDQQIERWEREAR